MFSLNVPQVNVILLSLQYKSRYEGDLVAKCYFAKHKLVWEVLDGGLKNKIEIQWSDIIGLKANYPDDAPGTLDIVVRGKTILFLLLSLWSYFLNCISRIGSSVAFLINLSWWGCYVSLYCSWQGNLFSLGRQIHNPESTHFGKLLQILLTDRLVYTGLTIIPAVLFFLK